MQSIIDVSSQGQLPAGYNQLSPGMTGSNRHDHDLRDPLGPAPEDDDVGLNSLASARGMLARADENYGAHASRHDWPLPGHEC